MKLIVERKIAQWGMYSSENEAYSSEEDNLAEDNSAEDNSAEDV
jgi:hypothetical protein